ncbi:hypothetical protein [Flavisolibacter nicotianae]|uniref:hypothetical protein n=1 Tax=Flavisolibacter nicotianae TaxID=2364882 RepID=UPI0013C4ED28|nr:hypothetical protein [Flavisolibacter nicotianae]
MDTPAPGLPFCFLFTRPGQCIAFSFFINLCFQRHHVNHKNKSECTHKREKGLFYQLKEKLTVLFARTARQDNVAADRKKTLTIVSVALVLLSIVLWAATGSLLPGLFVMGGLFTAVMATHGKQQGEIPTAPKNSDTPGAPSKKSWFKRHAAVIIAITLLLGGLAALAIAFGNMKFH